MNAAPEAVAPPPGNPRFPLFDGLRAIAALSVVVFHVGIGRNGFSVDEGWAGGVVGHLDIGVTIFFLISGFLLYRPFVAARLGGRRAPTVRAFARRRILRIVPAYWVALTLLLVWPGLSGVTWSNGWMYYGFAHIYSRVHTFDGMSVSWSLCTEMSFYVALPFYAVAAARIARRRRDPVRAELTFLAAIALASLLFGWWATSHDSYLLVSLPGTADWFALGMALAVVSAGAAAGRPSRLAQLVRRRPSATWAAAALTYALTVVWARESSLVRPLHVFYGVAAFLILLPAVFADEGEGVPQRILRTRVAAWLGLVSYGIYLWHLVAVEQLARAVDALGATSPGAQFAALVLPSIAAAVALGAASYYLVERPALRHKEPRRRRRPEERVDAVAASG